MDARADWRDRYLRRRRLRKIGLALLALLVFLMLVQSCSAWRNSSSTSSDASLSSGKSDAANSGNKAKDRGGLLGFGSKDTGNHGKSRESKKSDKPYAAIPPPKGSKPLQGGSGSGQSTGQYGGDPGVKGNSDSLPVGRMLVRGAKDPSDGPLKHNRLVAFYGTPLSGYMGVLGELPPGQMMHKLKQQTRAYSAADPERPAVPTIELIASVAQRNPGPDGLYVQQTPVKEIRRYAKLAKKNHALLLLDVQLGRDDLMNEVVRLEPFLKKPYVHLAIDTEYSVGPGQVPGVNLGSVAGWDIQRAVRYMDGLVKKEGIPDKLVLVHQFATGIVYGKQSIQPTSNVEVVLNADGFGYPAGKLSKYDILVSQQPIQYGGFKLFYRQDHPVLSPDEVLRQKPAPAVVNYQ